MFGRSVPDQQGGKILGRWDQRDGRRKKRKRGHIQFVLQKESIVGGSGSVRKELVQEGHMNVCLKTQYFWLREAGCGNMKRGTR